MKKIVAILLTGAMLTMAGFSLFSCDDSWKDYVYQEGDFELTIEVDKTEAKVGDEIEITATFKNLSGRDLPILFMDYNEYKKGIEVSDEELTKVNIHRDDFHGEWNYSISPASLS